MKSDRQNPHLGDYNVICDYLGFKLLASECRMTWDGYFVRADLWEPRHPQDFVRGVRDAQKVTIARPESTDIFLTANEVSRDDL